MGTNWTPSMNTQNMAFENDLSECPLYLELWLKKNDALL